MGTEAAAEMETCGDMEALVGIFGLFGLAFLAYALFLCGIEPVN